MEQVHVGVRELKGRLSYYLQQVKAGQSLVITERGRPVGQIIPLEQPLERRLEAMMQAGWVMWSGKRLEPMPPVAHARGERTVADLLVEDRE